jgi:hypothetical protein
VEGGSLQAIGADLELAHEGGRERRQRLDRDLAGQARRDDKAVGGHDEPAADTIDLEHLGQDAPELARARRRGPSQGRGFGTHARMPSSRSELIQSLSVSSRPKPTLTSCGKLSARSACRASKKVVPSWPDAAAPQPAESGSLERRRRDPVHLRDVARQVLGVRHPAAEDEGPSACVSTKPAPARRLLQLTAGPSRDKLPALGLRCQGPARHHLLQRPGFGKSVALKCLVEEKVAVAESRPARSWRVPERPGVILGRG